MKKTTPRIDEVETDAVDAILAVEAAILERLINRRAQVRSMMLAVVAQQHLLLEGPPGTAKTLQGALFASAIQGDFTFFKTQMLKSSLPEQLFGPINVGRMRADEPVYEHYTAGMLPDAHFAIIEEVFRASEMVLSAVLTIFNERKFHNGGGVKKCPLMTAIGTTNFVSQGEELEAFNDRWLIRHRVESLTSASQRRQLYELSLVRHKKPLSANMTIDQIRELHQLRREVEVPALILDLYEQLVGRLLSAGVSIPLTDRRQVQTLELVKASAVLRGHSEADAEDLLAAEHGLTVVGDAKDSNTFATEYQTVIGGYQKLKQEAEELDQLEQKMTKYQNLFDEKLPKGKAELLQTACRKMVQVMQARPDTYTSTSNEEKYQEILEKVSTVLRDVTEVLAKI